MIISGTGMALMGVGIRHFAGRLAFAILRATGLCVRGSRSKWRCLGLEDGAAIDTVT